MVCSPRFVARLFPGCSSTGNRFNVMGRVSSTQWTRWQGTPSGGWPKPPVQGPSEAVGTLSYPCRWFCPYPGCKRSFAELWRLKVHYRAPPDVRGSGRERGHGTELTHCPKCGKGLKPGKHHVGCAAGRTAPRQASKRSRSVRCCSLQLHAYMHPNPLAAGGLFATCAAMPLARFPIHACA